MGSIREVSSGRLRILEPENLVGRAPTCALRLAPHYVSGQHALLRWAGAGWEVKDLGSRNGTYLNGIRIKPGKGYPVRCGAQLAFGKLAEGQWELVDESAPTVMAVPVAGGDPIVLEGDLLALPSNDDPRVTIYRNGEGHWVLERPDESVSPLANMQTFEVVERLWRFSCTESVYATSLATSVPELEVRRLHLSFAVSRDEEHVEIRLICRDVALDVGSRGHNYLLLTLARRRLKDAQAGLPDGACGWIDLEELAHDPTMAPPQLNIDVFRIRKRFAALGVIDAANVIERRPHARQLRLGTGLISIGQI